VSSHGGSTAQVPFIKPAQEHKYVKHKTIQRLKKNKNAQIKQHMEQQ
jgi:hypothetical protein